MDPDAEEIGGISRAVLEAESAAAEEQDGAARGAVGVEELGEADGEAVDEGKGPPELWWEYKPAEQV